MNDLQIEAIFGAGHCTRARALENGCKLCKPKFEAIDRLIAERRETARRADERQAVIEILGKALAEVLPDFRASGTPVAHATAAAKALVEYVRGLTTDERDIEERNDDG